MLGLNFLPLKKLKLQKCHVYLKEINIKKYDFRFPL